MADFQHTQNGSSDEFTFFFFKLSVLKRVDHFGCAMRILRTVGTCLRVQNAKHFQVDPSGSAADGDP